MLKKLQFAQKMASSFYRNYPRSSAALSESKATPTIPNKASSIGQLLANLPATANGLKPRSELLSTLLLLPSTKKLFKLFMQIYLNIVMNQAQLYVEIQAPIQAQVQSQV